MRVPRTVTVWHRTIDVLLLGPCRHAWRMTRLSKVTRECSMYRLLPILAGMLVGPAVCVPRAPVTLTLATFETSSENLNLFLVRMRYFAIFLMFQTYDILRFI